jgi:two-component system nitrogen regulation sensor histidine kinase NtrY
MKLSFRSLLLLGSVLLLPVALILNFFVYQKSQEEEYIQAIEKKIHAVEDGFNQDFELFQSQGARFDSLSFDRVSTGTYTYPFFIINPEKELKFWSTNEYVLDFSTLDLAKEYQVLISPYGTFLVKLQKTATGAKADYFVQAFRLVWSGNIKNDFLSMGPNPEVFGNALFVLYPKSEEGSFQVKSALGQSLFGIDFQPGFVSIGKAWNTPLLIFSCSIFLLYVFLSFIFLRKKWKKGQAWQAIAYGFLILLVVRACMLVFNFPRAYLDLPLFDSSAYTSSWLIPSLGDLLLHTLCFALIFGLLVYQLSSKPILEKFSNWRLRVPEKILLVLAFLTSTLFFSALWWITRDLVLHARWSLDISAIPSFDGWVGTSFLVLFLWGAVYVFLSLSLIHLVTRGGSEKRLIFRLLFLVASFCLLGFFIWNFWLGIAGLVHFLFLGSILRFDLVANVYRLGLETFLTLFFASLIAATIVAASSFQAAGDRLKQAKVAFANQQLLATDGQTASFLSDIFSRLKNDLFIQNRLADPLLSKDPVVSKIRKIYLDNYFDQFEVVIRIFSPTGAQIGGALEGKSFKELQQEYIKSDFATSIPNLYVVPGTERPSGNSFFAFIPMAKGNLSLGTVYLELNQLRIQPDNAYPRLLLDAQYAEKLQEDPFNFGVFKAGELIRSSGSFNYQQEEIKYLLENPKLQEGGVEALGFQHLGVQNGEELWVLSSPVISIKQFFGTLSLFFVVFVSLTFFGILGSVLFQGYRMFEFNYSTKLQLYLNFAFFFPILIISLITTGLLSQSYKEDLNQQYLQKALLIKGNLVRFFADQEVEEFDRDALTEEISTLATTVGTDIHLYNPEGLLLSTSRAPIFDKKLLSNLMHPGAMAALVEKKDSEALLEERVGKLRYQAVYLAIPSQASIATNAVVAIPFFESEEELNVLISDVLGSVFNAFVVIFILFLIISFLVTKNLTLPFRLLTQKLKTTNLEDNEPMYWASKDEIGLLVNEYNQMLYKLEASKKVLASTEKESAWREMAKQVAHEIKNPLTPMKLTLQHLLRLEREGKLEDADKLKKSLETLIHQVDALSGIASSFSTFAKMPLPNNEPMNFKEVLSKVLELFKTDKRMELVFQDDSYTEQIPILGDDKLFGRVISNLIINGMQAVESGKKPQIRVWLWLSDRAVFLEISDNGKGIPEELRDKIFIPNFSTKSQGSGLGLAIAKSGVETAGGKIWFETEVGKGSTFFLTFPLITDKN